MHAACAGCGQPLPDVGRFCTSCGLPVGERRAPTDRPPASAPTATARRTARPGVAVLAVLAVLALVAGIGAALMLTPGGDGAPAPTETSSGSPTRPLVTTPIPSSSSPTPSEQ